ncbi:uncharacterized protein C8R40DRAFT_1122867 [Lentinula edodes]|uniref:uncharacterized protein n=1 Tax=Lentinula edodes TaxID=5353 RepID=UPI001E8EA0A9|nr:uncharacterized protein C8R40DRAFT_1122867 [Lentinula edodes]KAH7871128.1 hypothetical protein C8R40DRAFT_1122867 [Lentinula edodes]
MLPRFVNPYLTRIPTEKTSRTEVTFDDDPVTSEHELDSEYRSLLQNILYKRLHESLEFAVVDIPRKKRRKGKHSTDVDSEPSALSKLEPILFKLLSTAGTEGPRLINIDPPPPKPPPQYREPTYEDTEENSVKRRERAKAVAVDYDWVITESRKTQLPFPSWKSRITHASLELEPSHSSSIPESPTPTSTAPIGSLSESSRSPPIIILNRSQPLRHSRPPVPDELLIYHPYVAGAPPHPEAQIQSRRKVKPSVLRDTTPRA